jgi:type I restriction enzyme S subunit
METLQIKNVKKIIPILRFKEFNDSWKSGILNDYAKFYNGKAFKQEELLDSGKYPVLRVGNLFTNNNWYYSNLELEENKFIENNDLIYAWSATFGPRIWKGEKVIYHYHIWKVDCDLKITDKWFYFQILDNETAKMKANSSNGFALLHITKGTIENWKINIPSLPEQTKIASFLTAVDDKLQALKHKLTLLEHYKKGVMQKIFAQELRFKDENGKNYPDWEEKKVKDVFIVTRGNVLSMTLVSNEQNEKNLYPVYSSQTKNKGLSGFYNKYLFEDCITWTTDGAGAGDVNFRKGKFYCTNVCGVLKSDNGYANTFVAEILNSVSRKYVSYVGNPKLMNNVMSEIKISIPTSINEQTKIASFLSAIDEKIEKTTQQLTQTETFKKGLLQQLFV